MSWSAAIWTTVTLCSNTQKLQILVDFEEFKTPCVALCVNLVNSAM